MPEAGKHVFAGYWVPGYSRFLQSIWILKATPRKRLSCARRPVELCRAQSTICCINLQRLPRHAVTKFRTRLVSLLLKRCHLCVIAFAISAAGRVYRLKYKQYQGHDSMSLHLCDNRILCGSKALALVHSLQQCPCVEIPTRAGFQYLRFPYLVLELICCPIRLALYASL